MEKKDKIAKGNITETALEIVPFVVSLLDPEIVSKPLLVVAKVGQAIAGYFVTKFVSEYKARVHDSELKSENFATEKPALILTDLLRIIDDGKIDEERFRAMKSIFFMATEKNTLREQEEMAYRFFQIAKELSGEEILILSANYSVVEGTAKSRIKAIEWGANSRRDYWAQIISEQIGHSFPEIILRYENHLIELKLISSNEDSDRVGITQLNFKTTSYFRLTQLGYELCKFITKYK